MLKDFIELLEREDLILYSLEFNGRAKSLNAMCLNGQNQIILVNASNVLAATPVYVAPNQNLENYNKFKDQLTSTDLEAIEQVSFNLKSEVFEIYCGLSQVV